MSEEYTGEELSNKLLPAVEEQINSPDTPYVKEHLQRLIDSGEEEQEAKRMIALCLVDEVAQMQKEEREFDSARYQQMLDFLPILPE